MRSWLVVGMVVAASWPNAPARAQEEVVAEPPDSVEEEARALFVAGRSAFDAGRYDDALERFQRSYELSPRPALLYNVAVALDRLRRDQDALDAYERYLRTVEDTDERRTIEGRIDALHAAIEERRAEHEHEREAQAAANARVAPDEPGTHEDDRGSVASKWWFWTIVGLAVAGGATAAIVVATSGGGIEAPIDGDYGVVVMTLGGGG